MHDVFDCIRERHSARVAFDPERRIAAGDLRRILEAVRWAPTAHNMQNFEVIVVDDRACLEAIGAIRSVPSTDFLRENYAQLSFSREELVERRTGVLAEMFPPAWRTPFADPATAVDAEHASLRRSLHGCPTLLLVVYDVRKRAPASEGDVLGIMSLGCVMQNLWLATEALDIGMQVLSAVSGEAVEDRLHRLLHIPSWLKIGFACRLGYASSGERADYLRVRREITDFTHHDRYGKPLDFSRSSS